METTENPDEGFETSSAKVVTGVRTLPELKMQLTEEGGECGMSTSEYCEMLLWNRHDHKTEAEQLVLKIKQQQQEIETLKEEVAAGVKQLEVAKAENAELLKKVEQLSNQLSIFSDQRLIYLFENLKGKSDTVKNAYAADFAITYDTPVQVLLALIYSSKLNT